MPPDNDMIIYPHDHKRCRFYDNGHDPIVDVLRFKPGERLERDMIETVIAVVNEGRLSMSYRECHGKRVEISSLMLIPPGAILHVLAEEETTVVVFRLRMMVVRLCEAISLEKLYNMGIEIPRECGMVFANSHIRSVCASVVACVNSGFRCARYFESKISELLMLLKAYYPWEDLVRLFAPMLSADAMFKTFVMRHFKTVKSVDELARLANYSLSGFTKQFKKVIGSSPANWIREEKAKLIIHDLQCTDKTLKDIGDEYGFSSVSHLSKFCSHYLGSPPGVLRKSESCSVCQM